MFRVISIQNFIGFRTFSSEGNRMALSRFEYVKKFERNDELLRGCWIVIRIGILKKPMTFLSLINI